MYEQTNVFVTLIMTKEIMMVIINNLLIIDNIWTN